ncbi:MAG: hypothetical protein AAGB13_18115 [Cyanobacteria bacterium P01_F01_bin.33]
MSASREFIVYACPTGAIDTQLATYFQRSQTECGPNTAHRYMPHCTLTGFFHDESESVPMYVDSLERSLAKVGSTRSEPVIAITALTFQPEFHYLKLESEWLLGLVREFRDRAHSNTRTDDLRLKDWLHLSLAYGFPPEQYLLLQCLAAEVIDPRSPVDWELRFYEHHPDNAWTCHQSWKL